MDWDAEGVAEPPLPQPEADTEGDAEARTLLDAEGDPVTVCESGGEREAEGLVEAQREAEAQADSSTDSSTDSPAAGAAERGPGIERLREALAAASARQVDATLAARRAELDALEERLAKLRSDLEADRGRRADMAAEVAKRAQNRGDDARAPRREPGRE